MILNKRKDVVTNKRYERDEMIRISIQKDGTTTIDKDYNAGGRGIYIHKDNIKQAIEKKTLIGNIKRFNGNYEDIVEALKQEVENG